MTKTKKRKISSNIWKMTVMLMVNKRPYMTFLTIFLLTMPNATANTIGLLTLIGQIVGFLFEVPSGYVSDKIGHRNALIISSVAMVLSTACYVFADNIYWFFAGAILLSISIAFKSGTNSAFIHETLTALNKKDRYAEIEGKMRSIGFAVPIILILLLAVIAETNFRLAFGVMLIIDIIALFVAVSLVNPNVKESKIKEVDLESFPRIFKKFLTMKYARYALLTTVIFGIYFGSVIGFRNPFQESLGFSILTIGILWAISRVFISLLLLVNGKIYKMFTYKQFIILRTLVYAVGLIAIGLSPNIWIVAVLFIIITTTNLGLSSTGLQYDLELIGDSNSKATLLSIRAFMGNIFTGLSGLGMGALIVAHSYPIAYLVVGLSLLGMIIISLLLFKKSSKRLGF
jgi:MFS family permease